MPPSENSDRPIQPTGNVQPVQQPHQQPDADAEFVFFLDTVEHLQSKPRFFSAPNVRQRYCANTPRTNNEKGETKIIVAIIPPPPKLNGKRISPQARF
ncbi:hypothetical protein niasHT_004034 [Heterodera trifolii]|uniref:Uncharacterized protein n=1 Tax=Heterodera trifolii TaxID=157864 RepID=A0ABD2LXR0_9BILA